MDRNSAEVIGIRALGWLANNDTYLTRFLDTAGASVNDLRTRAAEPEFLGFVLDFMLGDDAIVLAFCEDVNCPPQVPMQARAMLPGGEMPNWT